MKIIAAREVQQPGGEIGFEPVEPFPSDAIAKAFDGEKWTIYQPGDDVPEELR